MSDHISAPTIPSVAAQSKRRWRWLKITLGVVVAAFLLLRLIGSINTVDLQVRRIDFMFNDDGKVLEITNSGQKALKITAIVANDRDDCKLKKLVFVQGEDQSYPVSLKIGDTQRFVGSCRAVRATVETDQGSNTYTFNR